LVNDVVMDTPNISGWIPFVLKIFAKTGEYKGEALSMKNPCILAVSK